MNKAELQIIYDYVCLGRTLQEIADTRYSSQYTTRSSVTKLINDQGFNTAPILGHGWSGESRGAYPRMSFETFIKTMKNYRGQNIDDFRVHEAKINASLQQKPAGQTPKKIITSNFENSSAPSTQPRNPFNLKPEEMHTHELEKMKEDGYEYSYELRFWSKSTFESSFIPQFYEWKTNQLTLDQRRQMELEGYTFDSLLGWYKARDYMNLNTVHFPKTRRDVANLRKVIVKLHNPTDNTHHDATLFDLVLASFKGKLTELVINKVDAGELSFDVVLFSDDVLPEISFVAYVTEERKVLKFAKPKRTPYLMTYQNFILTDDDITNVNGMYLIPRGYRIAKISHRGPVAEHSGTLCTLLCERL